jgi:Asp-tRNA(Asn)/Glu-tRNA(Gln) amidotransferase A subunit family amidase
MCPLAEGTDLGGSLRGPASFCGVVGFRTTPGLIPRYPSVLAWDTYSVEGPMARGARVEGTCPDMSDVPEIVRLTRGLLMVARHADKLPQWRAVLQPGLVENTEQGLALSPRDIAEGELLRTRQWQRVHEFFRDRDLLLTPTMAVPAFPLEHPHIIEINGRPVGKAMARSFLTYAFSVLGLPAISIPCGFTQSGLPVGLQIVGKRRGEAAVLRAAAAFEAARPWADRIPPVVTPHL